MPRRTFKVKDYRIDGLGRYKTMTLDAHEFIRRFLIHVLPKGFHRIRHYGLLASAVKADSLALARKLLDAAPPAPKSEDAASDPATPNPCPCCGSAMRGFLRRSTVAFRMPDVQWKRNGEIPSVESGA
jgi:hypothetical protein